MRSPTVSIITVSFRHAAWIGQTIESVLAQDFDDWELIIADDASDDDTVDVARSYLDRCEGPSGQRLRILPCDEKIGPRKNYVRALQACRGRYTAQLDGDDFWVVPDKLSAQVATLDGDSSLVGCFGAWHETDRDGRPEGDPVRGFGLRGRERFTYVDFASHCITTTCVAMFRTGLVGAFPDWYMATPVGDWPLHMLNALHGDYVYVDRVLAAHRNHSEGVWTKRSVLQQIESTVRTHNDFLEQLPEEVAPAVRRAIMRGSWGRARGLQKDGEHASALALLESCARHRTDYPARFRLWRRLRQVRRAVQQVEAGT